MPTEVAVDGINLCKGLTALSLQRNSLTDTQLLFYYILYRFFIIGLKA